MNSSAKNNLKIGWSSADLTPKKPMILAGQFHARVSESVLDPITATILTLDSDATQAVIVSCDFAVIPDALRDDIRASVREKIPELNPQNIFISATHSHSAPEIRTRNDMIRTNIVADNAPTCFGLGPEELGVMAPQEYVAGITEKITAAIINAWHNRAPGGIGFGMGQAVVGRNRRLSYYNGESKMYGNANDPEFSHIEGYEDHSVNLLCTYDQDKKLTGMIVNLACPSQVSEVIYQVSADFWHDTRVELRRRLGDNLFILPQCSAAGDQSPHILLNQAAEARMLYLKGLASQIPEKLNSNLGDGTALRKEIALRIADGVTAVLPAISRAIDYNPVFSHATATVELPMNNLAKEDADAAMEQAKKLRARFDELKHDFEEHPEKKNEPHWYMEITASYRRMLWYKGVADRFERQSEKPCLPIEIHILRLGDLALTTNPFEYFLDYAVQIKARSPAVQTLVVQLTGTGTYVPSERSLAGKGYGAIPASNPFGPEAGRKLVEATLRIVNQMWQT